MGEVLLQAYGVGNVHPIRVECGLIPANIIVRESEDLSHQYFRHYGASVMSSLHKLNLIQLNAKFENNCKTCHFAKSHRLSFGLVEHSVVSPL